MTDSAATTFRLETRFQYLPSEPIPAGWRRGNQSFVDDDLHVFWYDPAVPFEDRKDDGSTHRWVVHRRVVERRMVSEWEAEK